VLFAFILLACAPALRARPIVPALERPEREVGLTSAERGWVLLHELNCLACHRETSSESLGASKTPPKLASAATRIRADHLRRFVSDPAATKPGTTMPGMFHGRDATEVREEVESI